MSPRTTYHDAMNVSTVERALPELRRAIGLADHPCGRHAITVATHIFHAAHPSLSPFGVQMSGPALVQVIELGLAAIKAGAALPPPPPRISPLADHLSAGRRAA